MKWYYVMRKTTAEIVGSTKRPSHPFKVVCHVENGNYPACCYEIFHEEDGTCVALISERKLANWKDKKRANEYNRSK